MKKKLICGGLVIMCCGGILLSQFINKNTPQTVTECRKKIHLNKLASCAGETQLENITIDKNNENVFDKDRLVYSVDIPRYSIQDIERIAKALHTNIKETTKDNDTDVYKLKNNGLLMCYKNSGTITYMRDDIQNEANIDKDKCIKIARDFLEKSKIIPLNELYLDNVDIGCMAETSKGQKILSYKIIFKKIPPKSIDGYDGVGPGICINIDANYDITDFVSLNKTLTQVPGKYDTLSLSEAEKAIINNKDVQIIPDETEENTCELGDVTVTDVKVCLYSDPASYKQDYMAPYYVMNGTDESGSDVTITLPALNENEIETN